MGTRAFDVRNLDATSSVPELGVYPPRRSSPPLARSLFRWPASTAINLLIAGSIGFSYTLLLLGQARLDPTNLSWLEGDAATYYIGWELFRQDTHFHWPLTSTNRLGYPLGDSIAFLDLNPLLATVLKLLSPLLPTPFQYLGIAVLFAVSLQFFFATRLFQMLLGRNALAVFLFGLFFVIAPPMTWRFSNHYALANHWLLVAALCLFVSLQTNPGDRSRRLALLSGLLGGVAVGVNAYLALMVVVVVTAGVITACWRHRLSLKAASGILTATATACLIFAVALGLLRSDGGYRGDGYREYSMNLLAPIDPGVVPGVFLRSMPLFSPYQYEGYNYLGAGVLMLCVMLLPSLSLKRLRRLTAADVVPLTMACLVLTACAVSTKITAGSVLIADLDPHQVLTRYLAMFRASGRLFWAPYYVILTAVLVTAFAIWKPRKAAVLITVALVVQFADTLPLRNAVSKAVGQSHPLPFHSPQWSSLGKDHANLLVFPPWQCGRDTPGGEDGFRIFGLLAVSQHMKTNSYYAARYSPASLAFHCDRARKELMEKPLSPDSAYVVSPSVARIIAAGPTGPSACHTLDGFILCSAKTDLGLGAGPSGDAPMMYASGRIESWRDAEERGYFIGDWQPAEPEGVWSKGHGILVFRLSAEQRGRYRAVSLQLMVPVGARGVQYHIKSGSRERSGAFLGSSVPRVEAFKVRMPLQDSPDGLQRIVLITQDAVRPVDIGLNSDGRVLGLAVLGVRLVP